MALTDKLAAIGDAIRSKTGSTDKLSLSQMVTEIEGISGIDDEVVEFSQVNDTVASYLDEADSSYTDSNYSSVTVVSNYADASANYDDPLGYDITIEADGTIYFQDETDGRYSFSDSCTSGTYTVYNLIPGHIYRWFVTSSGGTEQNGKLKPTGHFRQIYCASEDNCRDLGGWDCDGGTVRYNVLFRGMDPSGHAIDSTLINLGVRNEIDLQEANSKFSTFTSGIGDEVVYYNYPFSVYYKDMVDLTGDSYPQTAEVLTKIMMNAIENIPTYFHCSLGSDRTGTISYMLLGFLGVAGADCDKDYEMTALTGSLWGGSIINRTRNNHPKDFHSYICGLTTSGIFLDGLLYWASVAGMNVNVINNYRRVMTDGTYTKVSFPIIPTYTNQITISTDTDGSVYGYKSGYYMSSSSGSASRYDGYYLTGFIPVVAGDIVRLSNITFNKSASDATIHRLAMFNSSKTFLGMGNAKNMNTTYASSAVYDSDGNLTQFTVGGSMVAYFRLCCSYIGDDSIITVNEEIE